MADLLSFMLNNNVALGQGLSVLYRDSLTARNLNDWRPGSPDRERKRIPWYRREEKKQHTDEYRWRMETERHVAREIKNRTPSGQYLEARRQRVLAALGMSYEMALSKLTFEGKGANA
jgi:hypothetical protein